MPPDSADRVAWLVANTDRLHAFVVDGECLTAEEDAIFGACTWADLTAAKALLHLDFELELGRDI